MNPVIYEDFKIAFHEANDKGYPLTVESPEGNTIGRLSIDLDRLLPEWQTATSEVSRLRRASAAAYVPRTTVETLGAELFTGLFRGQVRTLWDQNFGRARGRSRKGQDFGLRLKLQINPDEPSLAPLLGVPWEFLYKQETRDYLNLNRLTPVVRYLSVQMGIDKYRLEPPLNVLVVVSETSEDPAEYPPLKLEKERQKIQEAWGARRNEQDVRVDFLPRATLPRLTACLQERDYHVLHFMGHGHFDPRQGGTILLEDESGRARPMTGSALATQIANFPSLRLVFLNACDTARMAGAPGHDPFAGVAAALVMRGLPAVIAMQWPITDEAAVIFAGSFYRSLAGGAPVDYATTKARLDVHAEFPDELEWGVPVLFMRTDDGRLFTSADARAESDGAETIVWSGGRDLGLGQTQAFSAPRPARIPEAVEVAIRTSVGEATVRILKHIPEAQHGVAQEKLNRVQSALILLDQTGALAELQSAIEKFARWPASTAALTELLQEPVMQARARVAGEATQRQYEQIVFPRHWAT